MLNEALLARLHALGAVTVTIELHHDGRHDLIVGFADGRTSAVYGELTFERAVATVVQRTEEWGSRGRWGQR